MLWIKLSVLLSCTKQVLTLMIICSAGMNLFKIAFGIIGFASKINCLPYVLSIEVYTLILFPSAVIITGKWTLIAVLSFSMKFLIICLSAVRLFTSTGLILGTVKRVRFSPWWIYLSPKRLHSSTRQFSWAFDNSWIFSIAFANIFLPLFI